MRARAIRLGLLGGLTALFVFALAGHAFAIAPYVEFDASAPGNSAPTTAQPEAPYIWFNVPVTLTFHDIRWDDPIMEGTYDISAVSYSIDGGPMLSSASTSTLALASDGVYSVRCDGTWGGSAMPIEFGIDSSPPDVSLDATAAYAGTAVIHASASDRVSHMGSLRLKLDDGPWVDSARISTSSPGSHVVYARARDVANNSAETSAAFTVTALARRSTLTRLCGPTGAGVNRPFTLHGSVTPTSAPGFVVIFARYYSGGKWRFRGSKAVPVRLGRYWYRFTAPRRGLWRFTARYLGGTNGSSLYLPSRSANKTVVVR